MLSYIVWSVDPEIFSLGALSLRYYGILFFLGFLIGYEIMVRIFRREGRNPQDVDSLTIYMLVSTVVGARLGHCLFYEPAEFLANPIEILYIWKGGLASHGAAVGILIALFLYSRSHKDQSYLYILDRIVITIALAAFFIRMGNLMNSEIVGKPTGTDNGVVFARGMINNLYSYDALQTDKKKSILTDIKVQNLNKTIVEENVTYGTVKLSATYYRSDLDLKSFQQLYYTTMVPIINVVDDGDVDHIKTGAVGNEKFSLDEKGRPKVEVELLAMPRYPSQVFEAVSSLILFVLMLLIYRHYGKALPDGLLFSIFLIWIFGLRFVYEYLKENQVAFEDDLTYNMGQILSIPLVLTGVIMLVRLAVTGKLKKVK